MFVQILDDKITRLVLFRDLLLHCIKHGSLPVRWFWKHMFEDSVCANLGWQNYMTFLVFCYYTVFIKHGLSSGRYFWKHNVWRQHLCKSWMTKLHDFSRCFVQDENHFMTKPSSSADQNGKMVYFYYYAECFVNRIWQLIWHCVGQSSVKTYFCIWWLFSEFYHKVSDFQAWKFLLNIPLSSVFNHLHKLYTQQVTHCSFSSSFPS